MGMDAWSRAATESEVEKMCHDLEQALAAGALGLSTNLMDHDGSDRPVPSLHADDAEIRALLEVLARHRSTTLQVVIDTVMRMTAVESLERVERLIGELPIRLQWAGLPTLRWQKEHGIQKPLLEMHERYAREGRDFYTGYAHVPVTTVVSFDQSLLFAQSNEYVWHEVITAVGADAKFALLRDPEWRARARHSWDVLALPTCPFRNPRPLFLDQSQNGTGPLNITLGEYADSLGVHPSDALAEWLLANGIDSTATAPDWDRDDAMIERLLRDPFTVGNISDAGAHGQMFCGAGDNIVLFTQFVREQGVISVEEAVHIQTGKLANFFGFADRGEIAPGKRADVAVFALDEVERQPKRKVYDVPDGVGGTTWRWTRDAAPMRLTLVNGVATFEAGKATGARPGTAISPASAD
jgi:N-acyl-D-amino-acid deacylase